MSRYIDGDKIIDIIKKDIKQCEIDASESYGDECYEMAVYSRENGMRYILREIEMQPAADVVEVRCGEWGFDGMGWTCSWCGEYALLDKYREQVRSKFCPHCGTKMHGERRENET